MPNKTPSQTLPGIKELSEENRIILAEYAAQMFLDGVEEGKSKTITDIKAIIGHPYEDSEMVDSVSFPGGEIHTADWKRGYRQRSRDLLQAISEYAEGKL